MVCFIVIGLYWFYLTSLGSWVVVEASGTGPLPRGDSPAGLEALPSPQGVKQKDVNYNHYGKTRNNIENYNPVTAPG